ncbi:MAG: peptidylprolyl isomerase, partial [Gemmata sp.]
AGAAAAGYAFGTTGDWAAAQPAPLPAGPGAPKAAPQPEPDRRVTAYVYGNVAVTREELGEFLIARGGHEKLELLVNKRIIEIEAQRRGVTVTDIEVRAALDDEMRGLGIARADFVKHVLPKYGKTLFEWVEDVVKPRLYLTKMCRDRIKITEEDLKRAFENRYGEHRQAKVICWSREDLRAAQKQWDEARKGEAEFDAVARTQADPTLAAACGLVKPVGRYSETADNTVEKVLFTLKVNEISQLFDTPSGIMCMKLVAVVPPKEGVQLDDKLKAVLTKELAEARLNLEIPKFFAELKAAAKPQLYLKGPPTAAEFREGVEQLINQAGGVPNVPTPAVPATPVLLPKP